MVKKSLLGVSLMTMTLLYALLFFVVFILGFFINIPLGTIIIISIIVLIVQFLISPFLTDLSMKWFYKAKFSADIPEYLQTFIQQVCDKYQMKYPKIGYINDGAPNAFTYGHTKNDARIVITRGILEMLTEDEVKAVVAHELGHAVHYDMLFMTVAQLVPLVLYYIYDMLIHVDSKRNNNNNNGSGYTVAIALIAYLLYIVSEYIVLWLSRQREYYADDFSIAETKNPTALGNALVKIGYGLTMSTQKEGKYSVSKQNALGIFDSKASKSLVVGSYTDQGINKLHIQNAMKWEMWNVWAIWYELQSTHPLISKRLKNITEQCSTYQQPEFINFNLQKPESYVDDFFKELLILLLPGVFGLFVLVFGILAFISGNQVCYIIAVISPVFAIIAGLYRYCYTYRTKAEFTKTTVNNLLGEVKVSGVTSIPCTLEGTLIGKGDPGCMFDEDFVLKDETGIIFLDYNRVLQINNLLFAILKSKEYLDKKVTIKGWYLRKPVPYVVVLDMTIDNQLRHFNRYTVTKVLYVLFIVLYLAVVFLFLF